MENKDGQARRVIIVVDMLRGFLEPGYPLDCGEAARAIIPAVRREIEEEMARGATILWVADNHAPDDAEFAIFPPHCIRGSAESEISPRWRTSLTPQTFCRRRVTVASMARTLMPGWHGSDRISSPSSVSAPTSASCTPSRMRGIAITPWSSRRTAWQRSIPQRITSRSTTCAAYWARR